MINIKSGKFVGSSLFPILAATTATCLMGSTGVFVRHISMSEETIVLMRFGLGLLFLVYFLLFSDRLYEMTFANSVYPIFSGVLIALCMLFYIKAIKLTTLASAAILLYLGPLLAAALAYVFIRERLSVASGLLVLSACLGCILIFGINVESDPRALRGNIFAIASAIFYALFIITNRLTPYEISPLNRAFYQLLVGTIVLAPFAEIDSQQIVSFYSEIFWIVAMGFLQGFLSVTLMIYSIAYLKTHQYVTISYFEPFVASLAGIVLYDETITIRSAFGGIIILISGVAQALLSVRNDEDPFKSEKSHG